MDAGRRCWSSALRYLRYLFGVHDVNVANRVDVIAHRSEILGKSPRRDPVDIVVTYLHSRYLCTLFRSPCMRGKDHLTQSVSNYTTGRYLGKVRCCKAGPVATERSISVFSCPPAARPRSSARRSPAPVGSKMNYYRTSAITCILPAVTPPSRHAPGLLRILEQEIPSQVAKSKHFPITNLEHQSKEVQNPAGLLGGIIRAEGPEEEVRPGYHARDVISSCPRRLISCKSPMQRKGRISPGCALSSTHPARLSPIMLGLEPPLLVERRRRRHRWGGSSPFLGTFSWWDQVIRAHVHDGRRAEAEATRHVCAMKGAKRLARWPWLRSGLDQCEGTLLGRY